ncbi:MAG: TldD/PmbA family protein [Gemmatimonadales bacterium]
MTISRRTFVQQTSAAATAASVIRPQASAVVNQPPSAQGDPSFKLLAMLGLDAARSAGATYADIRIVDLRTQAVRTRDQRITGLSDNESRGFGVRALASGAWGFAASPTIDREEIVRVAREAVMQARANSRAIKTPITLAPVSAYPDGYWESPIAEDPFAVALEDKIDLLLEANRSALTVKGAQFVSSAMRFVRHRTTFASTEGSVVEQVTIRSYPTMSITAVAPDYSDFQTRTSSEIAPMGLGYEYVRDANLIERAERWAEQAVQKISAAPVEPGTYDLVLHPSNLFLTIHESIGHPTELDRAMGLEANYAGTSFLSAPEDMIQRFRYGPEFMNVQGDRTQHGALATVGWDDEGVPSDSWPIVKDGVFVDYQTTREQAGWISGLTGITRSHGCSFAQSWDQVQFQRMPNVSLLPGEEGYSLQDIIAATDNGILVIGRGSYSIDQQRYNFQFGGQAFFEIKGGRLTRMLKDLAYQGTTPEFWNSLDMLGGAEAYELGGTFGDSKGQPAQANAVSHGCPPARFRNVKVIDPGRA